MESAIAPPSLSSHIFFFGPFVTDILDLAANQGLLATDIDFVSQLNMVGTILFLEEIPTWPLLWLIPQLLRGHLLPKVVPSA